MTDGVWTLMSGTKKLAVPTVHLNGTSKQELLKQIEEAYSAVCAAMEKLSQAAPNARDYYVQPDPRAFYKAQDQHCDRMKRLKSVAQELNDIAEELPV